MKVHVVVLLVLLAGCSGKEAEPTQDVVEGPFEAAQPEPFFFNDTRGNAEFMGVDGTLFLTSGPGLTTVPELIYTVTPQGKLVDGRFTVSWSSTSAPTMGMELVLSHDGELLERVSGMGTLELELPAGVEHAELRLVPAGPVGAHFVVQWDLEFTSRWIPA